MKNRKVLVAGGMGLIGANMTQRLRALGADVRATFFSRKPDFLEDRFSRADLTDRNACFQITRGMDDVILCAAFVSGVEGTKNNPTAPLLHNLQINVNMIEACRINNIKRVLFISSSTVYQPADHPIRESELDLNQAPYELYLGVGNMNRYLENLCAFYGQRFGMKIGIVRPSNAYGPYDRFEDGNSHVLPALIKRALAKEKPFAVWGNPKTVRDFIYVEDLVEDLIAVLDGPCVSDPLNLGFGKGCTIEEAVQVVLEVCGHKVEPLYDASAPTSIPYRVLDTSKFAATCGAPKRTSLRDGIRKTLDWYKIRR